MDWRDFVLTAVVVVSISMLASIYPAFYAAKNQSMVKV
jgi:ABC-type lipoprotein release transport system permease subunit